MSNIPNLNEMLKLHTKKELWERIQHHIKRADNLQHQLDQQKAMWDELKEFLDEDKLFEYFVEPFVDGYKNCLLSIKNKMQELEQEVKDD